MLNDTSLKDFKPFFGDDEKGPVFVQALFSDSDYTSRKKQTGVMDELMRAANYENYQGNMCCLSGIAQGPNDVHQDITDLIITTALFHRLIDKPTTVGTTIAYI